jgi:cysteinyl-tRNA synthetase
MAKLVYNKAQDTENGNPDPEEYIFQAIQELGEAVAINVSTGITKLTITTKEQLEYLRNQVKALSDDPELPKQIAALQKLISALDLDKDGSLNDLKALKEKADAIASSLDLIKLDSEANAAGVVTNTDNINKLRSRVENNFIDLGKTLDEKITESDVYQLFYSYNRKVKQGFEKGLAAAKEVLNTINNPIKAV